MKTAVVTGAGSGIGASTAALFHERGYHVVLVGRTREKLKSVASVLPNSSIEVCDFQKPIDVQKLGKKLSSSSHIEILVNNAGTIARGSFEEMSLEMWREQFETNLFAAVELTRELLKPLKKNRGSIVNVSSSVGVRPLAMASAYSATKSAVINWTQSLALELASFGVRVNTVAPGIVDTPILAGPNKRALSDLEKGQLGQLHPLGRLGRPGEIAEAIWYLARAEWTTGTLLVVDGGISLTQK